MRPVMDGGGSSRAFVSSTCQSSQRHCPCGSTLTPGPARLSRAEAPGGEPLPKWADHMSRAPTQFNVVAILTFLITVD